MEDNKNKFKYVGIRQKSLIFKNSLNNVGASNLFLMSVDDEIESWEKVKKMAIDGDAKAQVVVGDMLLWGVYEDKDYTRAIDFYNKALKQNFSEAMCKLGDCYFYGLGVEIDYEKAKDYYEDAERNNNKNAYCQLGIMYMMGKGVKKDYEKAKEYIYKSAKLINLTAVKIRKKCFENVSEKELYEMLDRRKLVKKNRDRKFEREEIRTESYVYNFYSERIYDADDLGMIVINDVYCDEWEGTFGEKDFIVDFGVGWFTGGLGGADRPGYVETYIRNIVQVRGIDYFGDEIFVTLTFKVPKQIR